MRVLKVTNTEIDLSTQTVPFLPGYTVVVVNMTDGSLTLQEAIVAATAYTTVVVVPALEMAIATINQRYIRVSTAANLFLLGN